MSRSGYFFSFSSDKDRRTDSRRIRPKKHSAAPSGSIPGSYEFQSGLRCVFSSDPAVSASIFVGAEREENLIKNDPDKSEPSVAICLEKAY